MAKKKSIKSQAIIDNVISIKGAKINNLKNIDLDIPKNKLVVVTGVSGSGKSSLVIDTIFAAGQRRYVESLSSYARQFLNRMKKPEVEYIKGLSPAIAIEQKVTSSNARSTVGTMTEIYDYLRLLFARIGTTLSPISGLPVRKHSVSDVVDYIMDSKNGTKLQILIPLQTEYDMRSLEKDLNLLLQKGYTRIKVDGSIEYIEDFISSGDKRLSILVDEYSALNIYILVDRIVVKSGDEDFSKRVADSVGNAIDEGHGVCFIENLDIEKIQRFSTLFELDGMRFSEPSHQLFNFNNPYGACPRCEGYGKMIGISEDKVIPDKSKSVWEGAVMPWKSKSGSVWLDRLSKNAVNFDFPMHRAYENLSAEEQRILWEGNQFFKGINDYFGKLERKLYKIQNRVILSRYRGKTRCIECGGSRLKREAQYVKIDGKSIGDLIYMPIDELIDFFKTIKLTANEKKIGKRILSEITNRLKVMQDIGLGYLTINRESNTLSGGESQRINLTRTLGSNLTSSIYILDEPSIGLHSKDVGKLISVLHKLKDAGNTVIVVEHDEDIMREADYLIDIGPAAGEYGGEVVFAGESKNIFLPSTNSITTDYLTNKIEISVPKQRRSVSNKITIKGARQFNLKNIDVSIPVQAFTVVTGVSGSGKTTLIKNIVYPALALKKGQNVKAAPGLYDELSGDFHLFGSVEMISQRPLGRSSRSNPVTYVKAYDQIRKLFSDQQLSKIRGYKPGFFSFNVEGGRCEACKGDGIQVVDMQFLADVELVCEDCRGHRFKSEILDVRYKEKNIYDVLNMSIEEGLKFFSDNMEITKRIQPLFDVGLGYIKLGQSTGTLSGGEAQRVKLASFLINELNPNPVFFIFDEPTTGLHFHDIEKLLVSFNRLVELGHTVLVIEHQMDVIKSADWIIDLGPDGGKNGGNLVYAGRPEGIIKEKSSYTGKYLKAKL